MRISVSSVRLFIRFLGALIGARVIHLYYSYYQEIAPWEVSLHLVALLGSAVLLGAILILPWRKFRSRRSFSLLLAAFVASSGTCLFYYVNGPMWVGMGAQSWVDRMFLKVMIVGLFLNLLVMLLDHSTVRGRLKLF